MLPVEKSRYNRRQLAERAALSADDMAEVNRCRRDHNRLGFAYQLGFVKLTGRLPKQEPLERIDELVTFMGVQLGLNPGVIEGYQQRRETIAQHRERIRTFLTLRKLGIRERAALETFVLEEACHLERSTALHARAKEFLKEQRILLPADSTLTRVVNEHRDRARQHIFDRIAHSIPDEFACTLDELLTVKGGQRVSALQKIKTNPSKPSVVAMLSLVDKLAVIEATGILDIDLSWLRNPAHPDHSIRPNVIA